MKNRTANRMLEINKIVNEENIKSLNEGKTNKYTKAEVNRLYKQTMRLEKIGIEFSRIIDGFDYEAYSNILMSDAKLTIKEFIKLVDLTYEFLMSMKSKDLKVYVDGGGAITGGPDGTTTVDEEWPEYLDKAKGKK